MISRCLRRPRRAATPGSGQVCVDCQSELPPRGRFCPECGVVIAARLFSGTRPPNELEETTGEHEVGGDDGPPSRGLRGGLFAARRPLRAAFHAAAVLGSILICALAAAALLAPGTRSPPAARPPDATTVEVQRVREEIRALERQLEDGLQGLDERLRAARSKLERAAGARDERVP